jgi:hypothetical protein
VRSRPNFPHPAKNPLDIRQNAANSRKAVYTSNPGLLHYRPGPGETVIEQIAIFVLLAPFIVLGVCWLLLLVYGFSGVIHNVLERPRFRLRTMLLAAAFLQVVFATVFWQQREGATFGITLFWLAGVSLVAWMVWVAVEDIIQPTASRRWTRLVRSERVSLRGVEHPATRRGAYVEPPPRVAQPRERTTTGE